MIKFCLYFVAPVKKKGVKIVKNREKYVKEIAEIICDGYRVAVLHTGKIVHCKQNICSNCKN